MSATGTATGGGSATASDGRGGFAFVGLGAANLPHFFLFIVDPAAATTGYLAAVASGGSDLPPPDLGAEAAGFD
ncbi:hypothetical protein [Oryza sativa Japonica Group]|uniref:Uncharacterized protein n=1 Tax=Oryza sativa subsp. japonica TaxID=39947 RepID=Q5NBC5_ORYSJ|nr:hypothetical protein [Oryza sativa Japonica Group]BAD81231.1 hypothetical protein [Oryza sativa Japonica Group]